jgi:hypothetical protein
MIGRPGPQQIEITAPFRPEDDFKFKEDSSIAELPRLPMQLIH